MFYLQRQMEWGHIEGGRFAHVWNMIVQTFREEDLISDRYMHCS